MDDDPVLRLRDFLPFRLNRLAAEASQHLAAVYRERYGIDVAEWRILATLGEQEPCTAQFVVESTRMHKTRVSRACAVLINAGYLKRADSPSDRRESLLWLSARGRRLYRQLVPLARTREAELLSCLKPGERKAFLKAMERLEHALKLA